MSAEDLTPAQLAHRCRLAMRPTKARPARTLADVCRASGWDYQRVYRKLDRAGLLGAVMGAKYEGTGV